ncbi:MAG: OmpH family outer membrane protein [Tannerella sp.]|jgi:outer membrane protein|nr:OmpH family outer membrane protein [Tannerella sp.]
MKNINYVINGVLVVAVVVLFILQFSGKNDAQVSRGASTTSSEEPVASIPVAYINVDSLLLNYNFSKDLNEQIVRKQENARANFTQQARNLQTEVENFQYKVQNGAFATQARAEQEQQRLLKKQEELRAFEEKLTQELMEENQRMNEQLRDTIVNHLKEYNKNKGYQMIFSNSNSSPVNPILLADDVYNITGEIIEFLNKRWSTGTAN